MFGGLAHAVSGIVHSMGSLSMASTGMAAAIGHVTLGRRVRHAIISAMHYVTPPEQARVRLGEPHAHIAVID